MCSCLSLQLKALGKDGMGGQSSRNADQCGMTLKAMTPNAVARICPCPAFSAMGRGLGAGSRLAFSSGIRDER